MGGCQQAARVASFHGGRKPQPRQGSDLCNKGTVPPYWAQQHRAGLATLKGSVHCPATRQMQGDKSDPRSKTSEEVGAAGERAGQKHSYKRAQARPGMELGCSAWTCYESAKRHGTRGLLVCLGPHQPAFLIFLVFPQCNHNPFSHTISVNSNLPPI